MGREGVACKGRIPEIRKTRHDDSIVSVVLDEGLN